MLTGLSDKTVAYLREQLGDIAEHRAANIRLEQMCGIERFFANQQEFQLFWEGLHGTSGQSRHHQIRREYGDFQTPCVLADAVCAHLRAQGRAPDILVEPTCGTGAFVLSALKHFPSLQVVHGLEIYAPYYWQTKGRILEWALTHVDAPRPRIRLWRGNVFTHDFQMSACIAKGRDVLVIGNPPWVTSAELSQLQSGNLPQKRNINALQGLDALTGHSNFDISETIVRLMLDAFAAQRGSLAMLVKHALVKHLVHELPGLPYALQDVQATQIDAGKWFNASVDAALLEVTFQASTPARTCRVNAGWSSGTVDFGSYTFGWVGERFVADIDLYRDVAEFDSLSPYEWRQGLKHDCANVMELRPDNDAWRNGLEEWVDIEPDLIYGVLKSSDLQQALVTRSRKYVLVTQRALGDDTAVIAERCPRTFAYLTRHQARLERRKSRIYRGRPPFSIFGIGEYAFAPYKVAISGLYKHGNFALVAPERGERPLMLDDTCYFLGFAELADAVCVWALLNTTRAKRLIRAITFKGDKRPYSKQRLMRIGLNRLAAVTQYSDIQRILQRLNAGFVDQISEARWKTFIDQLQGA